MTTDEALAWFEKCKPGVARTGARAAYEKAIDSLRAQLEVEKNGLKTIWETPESCPRCMEHLSKEWSFCPECGRPTDWSESEPLTLEELREMDEEPVYIRMGDGREGYAIIQWDCGCPLLCGPVYDEAVTGEPDVDFYGLKYDKDKDGHWGLHSLGWLAFRHKPKEVTK